MDNPILLAVLAMLALVGVIYAVKADSGRAGFRATVIAVCCIAIVYCALFLLTQFTKRSDLLDDPVRVLVAVAVVGLLVGGVLIDGAGILPLGKIARRWIPVAPPAVTEWRARRGRSTAETLERADRLIEELERPGTRVTITRENPGASLSEKRDAIRDGERLANDLADQSGPVARLAWIVFGRRFQVVAVRNWDAGLDANAHRYGWPIGRSRLAELSFTKETQGQVLRGYVLERIEELRRAVR